MSAPTQSSTTNGRISPKEAARRALAFLHELLENVQHVQLEEVELSDDESEWRITLSFADPKRDLKSALIFSPDALVYKQFDVDACSGEVRAMRIRQV